MTNPDDDRDLRDALRRLDPPPEPPIEAMWTHIAARAPLPRAHSPRTPLWIGLAAALLVAVSWSAWPRPDSASSTGGDPRRAVLDANWSRLPSSTAEAVRTSLSELDTAIAELDDVLRSDPGTLAVIDLRNRFDRQRDALIERTLADVKSAGD